MSKKTSKLGLGLVVGAVAAGLAALFLSPKSGKENRDAVKSKALEMKEMIESGEIEKNVKHIFGEVTDEGTKLYETSRKELLSRLEDVQDTVKEMDHQQFMQIVNDTMEQVKEDVKASAPDLNKVKKFIMEKWEETKPLQKKAKKTAAKATKKVNTVAKVVEKKTAPKKASVKKTVKAKTVKK